MQSAAPDYDVLVVGGGIHGVGVAQASQARGYRTLLVEKTALAAGTSSRSSKLIHGGLRYLETFEFGLVRESLRERQILTRIAPDLVSWMPFLIPIRAESTRGPWTVRAGLTLYALLSGFNRHSRFSSLPRREWQKLDDLNLDGLRAVFRYWDAQTDDALLTAAVMQSARDLGAELACPAELMRASREGPGYKVEIDCNGESRTHFVTTVVNAAGPWINSVAERAEPALPRFNLELVQGTHIILDEAIEEGVYYLEAPSDGRPVFVIPWYGHAMVGTTETSYQGCPSDVRPLDREVEYLLETFSHHFPNRKGELLESFAGLRVLPGATTGMNERTRETTFLLDDESAPHWLTIAGGKLTGYRATAKKAVDRIASQLPAPTGDGDTRFIRLQRPIEDAATV